jgi:hypothetical protein
VRRAVLLLSVLAACATDDRDDDGILDVDDQCPDEREDFDQFQDEDGCPDQWRVFEMAEPRLETAVGTLGTRLVLAGGFSASMFEGLPITTKVLTFDTLTTEWGELPELPVAWTHANIAAVGGVVFALGGLDGRSFVADGRMFALEANATEWTPLGAMSPEDARGASAVVVWPGHIFLIGGATTTSTLSSILDFDLETRTLSRFPVDLPIARSHAAAMRRSDGMFVVAGGLGGLTGPQALSDVWVLPQQTTVWKARTAMPTARGGCAYGELYGNLICAGGETTEALDVVELYNVALDAWESSSLDPRLEPMPGKRAGARGAVVANRLYVPGGSETLEFIPTTTLFEFTLTAR